MSKKNIFSGSPIANFFAFGYAVLKSECAVHQEVKQVLEPVSMAPENSNEASVMPSYRCMSCGSNNLPNLERVQLYVIVSPSWNLYSARL